MMLFVPTEPTGSWKVNFSADESAHEVCARAELNEKPLRVFNSATNNNGDTEFKIDERPLSRGAIDFEFTAVRGGEDRSRAKGRLVKVAN
jgi:hypothetical protein